MHPEKKMVCEGINGVSSPRWRNSDAISGCETLQMPVVVCRLMWQVFSQKVQLVKMRSASSILRSRSDFLGGMSCGRSCLSAWL